MPSPYENTPCYLAGVLSRLHLQAMQARLAAHKTSAAQLPVLQCLWQQDGLTQSQICRTLRVEQPTLANTISRMVRDGLVRKVKDTNDRRQTILRLTPRAKELEQVLNLAAAEVLTAALQGFDSLMLDQYMYMTRRMIANMEKALEHPEQEPSSSPQGQSAPLPGPESALVEPSNGQEIVTGDDSSRAEEEDVLILRSEYEITEEDDPF